MAVGLVAAPASAVPILVNGGFESGFTAWTRVDQAGGDGIFALQSGAASPVNLDPVPSPPGGTRAAMTDGSGPGAHVLYQDFVASVGPATLRFDLFLGNRADRYATPTSLDFALTNQNGNLTLNQQARVDILRTAANPFSVAAGDVLFTLYATTVGDALVSGYRTIATDLTAFLAAHAGEALRLRFAETDNLAPFQMGVDNVGFSALAVPEPPAWALFGLTVAVFAGRGFRHPARRSARQPG